MSAIETLFHFIAVRTPKQKDSYERKRREAERPGLWNTGRRCEVQILSTCYGKRAEACSKRPGSGKRQMRRSS